MTASQLLIIVACILVAVIVVLLDGLKRRRTAERLAKMSPEERAAADREAKVFRTAARWGK
jgi:hypothetical protein